MINEERTSKSEDTVTKDEECDFQRQRINALKAIIEKYQDEMTPLKNKVNGADMVVLLLKESKQDNSDLHKRNKALEAAISNLQRRLSKNGLCSSIALQDTELFVPGASKQTLDNLAKENVRLRNLLKNGNGHSEKKSADEIDELKALNEKLESENNLFKKDIESYEQKLSAISKEKDEEKAFLEQKQTKRNADENKQRSGGNTGNERTISQVFNSTSEEISELSGLLKLTVQRCVRLDEQLDQRSQISSPSKEEKGEDINLKTPVLVEEDYYRLKTQLDEAGVMNQRWQVYCQSLDNQILNLKATMAATVDEHQKEIGKWDIELRSKDAENKDIKKQAMALSKEVQSLRKEKALSNEEILKQQIQVCTEDFNNERKDREHAASKAKTLQDENTKLKAENTKLKAELERMKLLNNTDLMSRLNPPQQMSHQNGPPNRRYELVNERGPSHPQMVYAQQPNRPFGMPLTRPSSNFQQAFSETTAVPPRYQISEHSLRRPNKNTPDGTPHLQGQSEIESHSLPRHGINESNFASAYTGPEENDKVKNNFSMPPLTKRGSSTSQEEYLVCPKCSKQLDQSREDLMLHIDMCDA